MKSIAESQFFGDDIFLTPDEISKIKNWINFQYGLKVSELNIDEVVPVYLNKETGPRIFEIKFKAYEKLFMNEDELYKLIGRE